MSIDRTDAPSLRAFADGLRLPTVVPFPSRPETPTATSRRCSMILSAFEHRTELRYRTLFVDIVSKPIERGFPELCKFICDEGISAELDPVLGNELAPIKI